MSLRHGQGTGVGTPPPDDLYLGRVHADLREYVLLEAAFCSCDALCTCGWDDLPELETSQESPS